MPVRMQQRRVDMAPVTRVVDQQHRADREATEGIQREQSGGAHASVFRPKSSGTRISAVITTLGTVASSTQPKKGT